MSDFSEVVHQLCYFARSAGVDKLSAVTITFADRYDLGRFVSQVKLGVEPLMYSQTFFKDYDFTEFEMMGIKFKLESRK